METVNLKLTQERWREQYASSQVMDVRYDGPAGSHVRVGEPYLVDFYPGQTATIPTDAAEELLEMPGFSSPQRVAS